MITDKEKIEEIVQMSNAYQVYDVVDFDALREALREDLLEMAQWKDECHKVEMEKCAKAKEQQIFSILHQFGYDSALVAVQHYISTVNEESQLHKQ